MYSFEQVSQAVPACRLTLGADQFGRLVYDPAPTVISLDALYKGILLLLAFDSTHFDLSRQSRT
jgi:hypothetical protein